MEFQRYARQSRRVVHKLTRRLIAVLLCRTAHDDGEFLVTVRVGVGVGVIVFLLLVFLALVAAAVAVMMVPRRVQLLHPGVARVQHHHLTRRVLHWHGYHLHSDRRRRLRTVSKRTRLEMCWRRNAE